MKLSDLKTAISKCDGEKDAWILLEKTQKLDRDFAVTEEFVRVEEYTIEGCKVLPDRLRFEILEDSKRTDEMKIKEMGGIINSINDNHAVTVLIQHTNNTEKEFEVKRFIVHKTGDLLLVIRGH